MCAAADNTQVDGDLKWQSIINDPRPRPALSTLGDENEKHHRPTARPEPLSPARSAGQREDAGED